MLFNRSDKVKSESNEIHATQKDDAHCKRYDVTSENPREIMVSVVPRAREQNLLVCKPRENQRTVSTSNGNVMF